MARDYAYDILPEIKARYAVKRFLGEPVGREALMPLLEAARYAPSCYNEQPWRYILGDTAEAHAALADCLAPGNAWAKDAPVLILALTKKTFSYNGKPNAWAGFDAGQAAALLQIEAVRRGFAAHVMAGFDAKRARAAFSVPDDYDVIAMIALGKPSPEDTEEPGTRMPAEKLIL